MKLFVTLSWLQSDELITQRVHGFVVRPLSFKVHILKKNTKDMNPRLKTKCFILFIYFFRSGIRLDMS
jgi:hypothetical protein